MRRALESTGTGKADTAIAQNARRIVVALILRGRRSLEGEKGLRMIGPDKYAIRAKATDEDC